MLDKLICLTVSGKSLGRNYSVLEKIQACFLALVWCAYQASVESGKRGNRIRVDLTQSDPWRRVSGRCGLTHSAFPLLSLYAFLVSCWLYKGIAKLFLKPEDKIALESSHFGLLVGCKQTHSLETEWWNSVVSGQEARQLPNAFCFRCPSYLWSTGRCHLGCQELGNSHIWCGVRAQHMPGEGTEKGLIHNATLPTLPFKNFSIIHAV